MARDHPICPNCQGTEFVQVPIPYGAEQMLIDLIACKGCRTVIWPEKRRPGVVVPKNRPQAPDMRTVGSVIAKPAEPSANGHTTGTNDPQKDKGPSRRKR